MLWRWTSQSGQAARWRSSPSVNACSLASTTSHLMHRPRRDSAPAATTTKREPAEQDELCPRRLRRHREQQRQHRAEVRHGRRRDHELPQPTIGHACVLHHRHDQPERGRRQRDRDERQRAGHPSCQFPPSPEEADRSAACRSAWDDAFPQVRRKTSAAASGAKSVSATARYRDKPLAAEMTVCGYSELSWVSACQPSCSMHLRCTFQGWLHFELVPEPVLDLLPEPVLRIRVRGRVLYRVLGFGLALSFGPTSRALDSVSANHVLVVHVPQCAQVEVVLEHGPVQLPS